MEINCERKLNKINLTIKNNQRFLNDFRRVIVKVKAILDV
jgi:hypothetical protein